jgi:3-hydroxyisobutyrate dehydrogenase-like beta-hydroxyacid dehydrogenase
MRVGIIGAGAMGRPIACNCLAAGHSVLVYNRTRSCADELSSIGAKPADSIGQACRAEVVITVLADDRALEEVVFDSGEFLGAFQPDGVHICAGTISVAMAKRLEEAHARTGGGYISAPIIGRPEMAKSRQISVLAAGAQSTFQRSSAVLESISSKVLFVGETPWHANLLKLCGNFLLLSAVETLAEIITVLPAQGVAPSLFLNVMDQTLLKVPFYQSYCQRMISGDFLPPGFRLGLARKDMSLFSDLLADSGVALPIVDLLLTRLESAAKRGYGDYDTAALALAMQQDQGALFNLAATQGPHGDLK